MAPVHVRLKVALAGVVLSTTMVSGQQAVRPGAAVRAASQTAHLTAPRAAREIRSFINGIAVDSSLRSLRNVQARLRNLSANTVEETVAVNERGEFSFAARPDVPYVIEIADPAGRTIAVGDVIVLNPGEEAGAIIPLPSGLPVLDGIFDETASSVISTATGIGLTVVDPALPKVSPRR